MEQFDCAYCKQKNKADPKVGFKAKRRRGVNDGASGPRNGGQLYVFCDMHTGTSENKEVMPNGLLKRIAAAQADASHRRQSADKDQECTAAFGQQLLTEVTSRRLWSTE